jgi:hypothetical protein
VSLGGEVLADLRQVRLTVRLLDVGEECRPFARQRPPPPQEVPRGPPLGGLHRGWREHAAAQQDSDCVRIDLIVFRLATMAGVHGEGMPQDEGKALTAAQVGKPTPGEETFDGNHHIRTIGRNGVEERFRAGLHLAVEHALAILMQDSHRHAAGVQVDATGKVVRLGVESPQVSSFAGKCLSVPKASLPLGMLRRRPQ